MIWGHGNRMTAGKSLDGSLGWDGTGQKHGSTNTENNEQINAIRGMFNKWNGTTVLNRTPLYLGKKNKGKERKKKERKKNPDEEQQSALLLQLT